MDLINDAAKAGFIHAGDKLKIKDIDDFYIENSVDVYVPTLDKKLKFKPLSVSQMKHFIELQVKAQKEQNEALPSVDLVKDLDIKKITYENNELESDSR